MTTVYDVLAKAEELVATQLNLIAILKENGKIQADTIETMKENLALKDKIIAKLVDFMGQMTEPDSTPMERLQTHAAVMKILEMN